jgi:hypothetical protein
LAAALNKTRSQLHAEAMAPFVGKHSGASITQRLDEVYGRESPVIDAAFARVLASAKSEGNFYAMGRRELAMPKLEIDGVGRISFPLLAAQAEQIIAKASCSPFGRGENTVVDINVRRTLQIASEQVHLKALVKRCLAYWAASTKLTVSTGLVLPSATVLTRDP